VTLTTEPRLINVVNDTCMPSIKGGNQQLMLGGTESAQSADFLGGVRVFGYAAAKCFVPYHEHTSAWLSQPWLQCPHWPQELLGTIKVGGDGPPLFPLGFRPCQISRSLKPKRQTNQWYWLLYLANNINEEVRTLTLDDPATLDRWPTYKLLDQRRSTSADCTSLCLSQCRRNAR